MRQAKSTRTAPRPDGWAELLSNALTRAGRPEGEGWKTATEIAAETNKTRRAAEYYVEQWIRLGKVEQAYGTNHRNQRVLYVRPHPARA